MTINVEPLLKILVLEQKKGYSDSAVFGGLDRFLHRWTAQAVESVADPLLLRRFHELNLVDSDYASMNRQQRKGWISDIHAFVSDLESRIAAGSGTPETAQKLTRRVKSTPKPRRIASDLAVNSLDSPITVVKGISYSLAAKFGKLGVKTVRDLLYYFPNRHLDYSQVKFISQLDVGEEQTIEANVWQAQVTMLGGRRGTEAVVGDETGNVRVVWFNQPYLAKKLVTNTRIVLSGRVTLFKGQHVFESPEWEIVENKDLVHTARLVPLYPLTQGLRPRQVRKLMKEFIDQWAWQVEDFLPPQLMKRCQLMELPKAISQAHYPGDRESKDKARVRLAFDELFLLQLGVMSKKRDWQESQPASSLEIDASVLDKFVRSLPFELTSAQNRVLDEILADLQNSKAMSRLLQGEVGSGKTVVATAALLMAAANGYQVPHIPRSPRGYG